MASGNHIQIEDFETIMLTFGPDKDRIIRLLQAKTRMLEAALEVQKAKQYSEACEDDFITCERAAMLGIDLKEDIKLFENYRTPTKRAVDNIGDIFGLRADKNGELMTMTEEETVVAAKDLPDDDPYVECEGGFKYKNIDMTPAKEPTKVTLDDGPYPFNLGKDGPEEVHIIIDKEVYDFDVPKNLESENFVTIRAKKRG